jgi:hypothetical protein
MRLAQPTHWFQVAAVSSTAASTFSMAASSTNCVFRAVTRHCRQAAGSALSDIRAWLQ